MGLGPPRWAPPRCFAVLVWRLGTGPFLDGIRTVDGRALAAAAGLAVLTTRVLRLALEDRGPRSRRRPAAARRGGGVLPVAVPQRHAARRRRRRRPPRRQPRPRRQRRRPRAAGRRVGALRRAGRAGRPDRRRAARAAVAGALVHAAGRDRGSSWRCSASCSWLGRGPAAAAPGWARIRSAVAGDIRDGLLARRAWPGIALASALVVAGHAATFLIAARTAGATAPLSRLLPLALLVLLAMVLPSVAGWGPREGVAAWAFGAAGLGARRRASPPPSSTASWCSSPACRAPSSSWWHGSVAPGCRSGPSRRSRAGQVAVRPDGAPHA